MLAQVFERSTKVEFVLAPLLKGEKQKFLVFDRIIKEPRRELVLFLSGHDHLSVAIEWMTNYNLKKDQLTGGGDILMVNEDDNWKIAMNFHSPTLLAASLRDRPQSSEEAHHIIKEGKKAVLALVASVLKQRQVCTGDF